MRSRYWTCSKFANWLRGTKKPYAETMEGWDEWRKTAQSAHKFRYWLAEEGLDKIQNIVFWIPDQIRSVKYYINNRWVTKTHAMTSTMQRGKWHEFDERMLHCSFDALVDFVEIEQAWFHVVWNEDARKKFNSPWYACGFWKFPVWRSPEAGVASLEWAAKLKLEKYNEDGSVTETDEPTHQAKIAQETLALYNWWKFERPSRPDPYEVSGYNTYLEARREETGGKWSLRADRSPKLKKMGSVALKKIGKIEQQYEKEDDQMLIRLVKLRHGLWT